MRAIEKRPSWRARTGVAVVSSLFAVLGLTAGAVATTSVASAATATAPHGTTGTTINPLQYNCGNDAPTCGQVGENYGYYNGKNVELLYTENYYCAPTVSSKDPTTGCEAGKAPASTDPTGMSKDGTSLGNTTHTQTLYVAVPLFTPHPPTQCTATATCIDHPPTIDLSALASALTKPATTPAFDKVGLPAHDHIVGTRATDKPAWWNVDVVATKTATTFGTLTSVTSIKAALAAGTAISAPSNVYLFFQVLPGTVPQATASKLTATAPPGSAVANAPTPTPAVTQRESGQTFTNLKDTCPSDAATCETIGTSYDWIDGQTVRALYTEQYFCDKTVEAKSATGCEAGAPANTVPTGVATKTAPTPAHPSNADIDPLYIPLPIYTTSTPSYLQCPPSPTCIDHPPTIDLSRLASALGVSTPSKLDTVMLPGHDHLLTTRNGDQPEWWDVIVIPVTSPAGLQKVQQAKSYQAVKALEGVSGSGIGGEVATNVYLWFQTLPGSTSTPSPAPTQSAYPTQGYHEVASDGGIFTFGDAAFHGSMGGRHLNAPVVGMAADAATGGYWLVAADGGIFSFTAPFFGSEGGSHLNAPVVGMAATPTGGGYWLVAADGGIFSFGNAKFYGSMGGKPLNKPIVGMAANPAGGGYWLVAADGGIFTFGDAAFHGSEGGSHLNAPVVGMAADAATGGYWLVAADGGIFSFTVPFFGSMGGKHLNAPVVGMADTPTGGGYWEVAADGGIFSFGGAAFEGSMGGTHLNEPVVGMAVA